MIQNDVRRLIARLAVAVMTADDRITTPELASLGRLDHLGLGPLTDTVREEIERATHEPVDLRATCRALPPLGEEAAALLLTVLAEIAASDRFLAPGERDVFSAVAGQLGVDPALAAHLLEAAMSPPRRSEADLVPPPTRAEAGEADPNQQRAFRVLGLQPGASRSRIETTYLDLLRRYDPARVAELGTEFAALAVRRLAKITDAYEATVASLRAPA